MKAGLYLHVPFCRAKCPYCDFYSFPVTKPPEKEYLAALKQEILLWKESFQDLVFETFYAGGGTPSLLSPEFYEELFDFLTKYLRFHPLETTIEANPEGLSLFQLRGYRRLFNRLSLGAQSFLAKGLKILGRRHTPEEIRRAFYLAREAGFENLSLDLIFAWPGQEIEDLAQELEEALRLGPEHLSLYELSFEEGTRFFQLFRSGSLRKPPEEEIVKMFRFIWKRLEEAGFEHYEISNYAQKGYRCRHNLFYWRHEPFLGLGPGAASFLDGRRRKNKEDYLAYLSALKEGKLPPFEEECLDQEALFREAVVLGLRLIEGVSSRTLWLRFGFDLKTYYGERLDRLVEQGLLFWRGEHLALTEKGLLLANVVARELV